MTNTYSRWIARILLLTMSNPVLFVPSAMARDTEVYTGFLAPANTTIKPNVLFLLDTSDSMNLPEAWREYPGEYDSHVEYLWNDLSLIVDADANSSGEYSTVSATGNDPVDDTKISTGATPTTYFNKMGYWYGATLADRQALWQNARASAKGTEAGDPGPRHQYRNYSDLSWIYWLPTGTDESDPRLRSPSWNKFRGYIQELGNGSGGSANRGGPVFTDTNDYRIYNQCGASLNDLTPSTVLVPSSVARNSGKYTGQQWARWEPYLGLTAVNVSSYPGSSVQADPGFGGAVPQPKGYVDTTSPSTGNPASNSVYRDSYPVATPTANPPSATLGTKGLPVRYNAGAAGASWDDLKADAGGFVLRGIVDAYTSQADLDVIKGWYGLATTSDVDTSSATDLQDAKFIAWKGNRDASPAFGMMTGVPAYYDTTAATCDSSVGPSSVTCMDKQSGTTIPAFTLTKTANCNLTGTTNETDASGTTRRRGGSCTVGTVTTAGTDQNGSAYPSFSDVPTPTCPAPTTADSSITTSAYSNCTRGTTTVTLTAGTTCSLTGDQTLSVGNCSVSGANSVSVAACAMTGASTINVAACAWSGRQTRTIGSCTWSGRSAYYTEGVGWRATGGTCQESGSGSPSTNYCNGATDNTVYTTQAAAIAASASCTNTTPTGTYNYGGTCSENGATSSCSVSGGTTIPGLGLANASCTNAIAAGNYSYGGSCQENGSTSSCNAASGGTTLTIRGNTQVYNQTCSGNKANSGTTKNTVGTYSYGGTCAASQNNNICTSGTGAAFYVRGTAYAPTTCTNVLSTGTYHRGGTCSGSNVPCTYATNYGGTTITNGGNTWYSNIATCTPPTAATTQTYYSSCTGTQRIMPAYPPGGNSVTTNNTASACNFTTNTVNIGGTNYTNYDTCTNKNNVTTTCSGRYDGTACSTSCGAATPTSLSFTGASASHNYYRTYNFAAKTDHLVHDCKADDAGGGNPGGNTYMRNISGTLAPFGTAYNNNSSTSIASNAAAYSTSSAQSVAADAAKRVDMYSVNYLNWKYGPKSNGNPIGRKTRLQVAKDVLSDVTGAISGVRLGLMSFNQMEKVSLNSSGAHLDKAIAELDTTTRPALINSINALQASSATPLTESLYEAYRYFLGTAPWFGGSASGTNYNLVESRLSTGSPMRYVTEGADTSSGALNAGLYQSPIEYTCQANMVILVSDGAPENDISANTQILGLPDRGNISINQGTASGQFETAANLPYGPPDPSSTPASYVLLDELAYYMANVDARTDLSGDQVIKLSTVQFGVDAPILAKAAEVGGGSSYSASNADSLRTALEDAILAVSQWQPVGSSPAITYNVTEGKTDDVYLTAFSPSSNISWPGTLKKFKYGYGSPLDSSICGTNSCPNYLACLTGQTTVGSCGKDVQYLDLDPALGILLTKFRSDAMSFWTTGAPDGGAGNKGGSGQVLISSGSPDTRKLYTFIAGASTAANLANPSNAIKEGNTLITKTLLGDPTMTDARRSQLIGFAQGSDGTATSTWRTWAQYDSVHSTPVVDEKTGTTVYLLTSDGVMHAFDTNTGAERWAFMVQEGLPKIADFMANLVGDHLEVADGNPVQVSTASGKQLLIFGMRRGGRAYYALDITDPSSPELAWKISPSQICAGAACASSSDYAELGQAWSTPVVGTIRGYMDTNTPSKYRPVLVFGGGYDPNQDLETPVNDTMGRAIFVIDAETGDLIRKFDSSDSSQMVYSIPSDVLALDTTGDAGQTIDRVYVGDMGGNLWRLDLDDRSTANSPSGWSMVRLANLSTTTRINKLFNRPTMARSIFEGQGFDAIFVGGGDTQRPATTTTAVSGAFFMVKDMTVSGLGVAQQQVNVPSASSTCALGSDGTNCDFVDMTTETADLIARSDDTGTASIDKQKMRLTLKTARGGYVINLSYGEKVTSYARVIGGILYLGTYFPRQDNPGSACVLGGYGNQYQMEALSGSPLRSETGSHPLIYSDGYGRIVAHVNGFGIPTSIVGKGNQLFAKDPNPQRPRGKSGAKAFWYSVPQ